MRGTVSTAVAALVLLLALPQAQAPATPQQILDALALQPAATTGVLDPADLAALRAVPRVVVVDPGHGGQDAGVRGRGGATEKQIALDTARRLRMLLESRIGARVVLTREDDSDVSLDARTAAANSNRPAIFVSLHLNASPSSDASGTVVYSQRLNREGEEARREATRNAFSAPLAGGGSRTLVLLPWELAQARHVDSSARLAQALAEGLGGDPSLRANMVRQAPLRVLAGVSAPAALVELAYLTNSAQESLAGSEEFASGAAEALLNGVVRFLRQPEGAAR